MNQWYHIFSYFWWDNPIGIIASCIIIVLAVYLTFYIIIELIEFGYWIGIQSFKAMGIGLFIVGYTLIFIFLILPLDLISPYKSVSDSFLIYAKNIEKNVYLFYPKLEKRIKKTIKNQKGEKRQKTILPYDAPAISPKTRRIIDEPINNKSVKSQISNSRIPEYNIPKFYCSKCGKPFTPLMISLLNKKNETFCEICGQKYKERNNIPVPIAK
ncbi:MAG: hypothetical protein K9W44_16645 [Candidatus Lokiarchaeota archaeon]|nr:hypothetical protein [Candidatus Harpocratesius repetitus]